MNGPRCQVENGKTVYTSENRSAEGHFTFENAFYRGGTFFRKYESLKLFSRKRFLSLSLVAQPAPTAAIDFACCVEHSQSTYNHGVHLTSRQEVTFPLSEEKEGDNGNSCIWKARLEADQQATFVE